MSRLELEFIRRRRIPWVWLMALTLSSIWSTSEAVKYVRARISYDHEVERSAAKEQSDKRRRREFERAQTKMAPELQQRAEEERTINAALTYPWGAVLAGIEHPEYKDAALLSFVHDRAGGGTQLSVEALNFTVLSTLVQQFREENNNSNWYIASYQPQVSNRPPTLKAVILQK